MTLGSSKSNVLAIVPEVTDGTPVDPTGATDFVVLQPDASMTPSFELLQNEEIRASIGAAKGIQGLERPEMSFSHYLKHSGVEGTAPEISDILKAVFGATTVNGTERVTDAASSTSVVKLTAGGTDFSRGFAMLIKDGTNGYSIRPVQSMSTNDATLGFNLANAPAAGVGVGKCVNYSPANTGHQALSAYFYRGNGQALEVLSGAKVTTFGFNANAGEFINANFGMQGTKYHFNPIRIAAADIKLDFEDDGGDHVATIAAKLYRDPYELAAALQTAMQSVATDVVTCTFSSTTGKFTFTGDGAVFELKWQSGANTANTVGNKIGFNVAADDTGSLTYTSDDALTYGAGYTPSYDSADPLAAKNQEILLGDATDTTAFEAASIDFTMSNERTEVKSICAESGINSIKITRREVTIRVTALLDKHDADKFRRYRANTDTKFCYNFGSKSGGNWEAGKCGCLYIPTCTVTSFQLTDLDSVIGIEMELKAFVDSSGNGEVYLNFL
jgi:hypothetical protein